MLLSRAIAGLLLCATAGCALFGVNPPSVDVLDVQLTGLGLTEQQLAVTLCVTNPNATELAFRRVTAVLDVSGAPLATGATALPIRLPPKSSVAVPFTVVTTVSNLGPQLLGIVRQGAIDYRIHGTVTSGDALGITLPYSRSGQLDPIAEGLRLAGPAPTATPSPCAAGASSGV